MKIIFYFILICGLASLLLTSIAIADEDEPFVVTLDSTKGAKINISPYETTSDNVREKPILLVHGFTSSGEVWRNKNKDYIKEFTQNGYDVIVIDMRGNKVDTDGDHVVDAPVVGNSWGYTVRDLGDDVGIALQHGIDYLNQNLPDRNYTKADVVTHSTGALAVTAYSRSSGLISYKNNIDTIIELAPPNNGSVKGIANIKEIVQVLFLPPVQGIVAYEYCLELSSDKIWIPGSRMESEKLRKELIPESLFLQSIKGLGPAASIETFIAIGDEDWVVGDWSPVIEERDDIGYEYFIGLDHFNFCNSELVLQALLDKLEKGTESRFFDRYEPYRSKNAIAFLIAPGTGIDHPDDTFDVVSFAKGINVSPEKLFEMYMRIAGRKGKQALLNYWDALHYFKKAQEEIDSGMLEETVITNWNELLSEKNQILHEYFSEASKEYLECPDIAILANGFYNELAKLVIEKLEEPVRIVDHTFSPAILNDQKLLIIPSGGLSGLSNSDIFKKKLSEFVENGGTLICFTQQYGYDFTALPTGKLKAYGWQEDALCYTEAAYIKNFHQILSSQNKLYPDLKLDGYFTAWPDNTKVLLRRSKNLMPAMLMYEFGEGMVIVCSLYTDWGHINGQASASEIDLTRDLIRWSKQSQALPETQTGSDIREEIEINREFSAIEFVLRSPNGDILEKKARADPIYELGLTLNKPGIYCVDYMLYNSDNEIIQPQTEGFYFCFSQPPAGSIKNPDFTFNITTDSENYIQDAEAAFTLHFKNNTSRDEWVKCKARFSLHDIEFTESIKVPANTLVSFEKKIIAKLTDRLTANFYSSGNEFLNRAERGINVYIASVDAAINTDRKQYTPGQKVSIQYNIKNNSKTGVGLSLAMNIIDPKNNEVHYDTKTIRLSEGEIDSWKQDFKIPEDTPRGIYKIKLSAFSNSRLVGSKTVEIDIPSPLLYIEDKLPSSFFELLKIEMEKLICAPSESILAKIIINDSVDSAELDIRVLPSAEKGDLWGIIRDHEASPVQGANINSVYTNEQGRYLLKGLDRGEGTIDIRAPGFDELVKKINILAGDNNLDIALSPSKYGNLSGRVTDSIGSEVTLEPVSAASSDVSVRYAVVSGEGKFEFRHVPIGVYQLKVQPENITEEIQIEEGDNTELSLRAKRSNLEEEEIASAPINQGLAMTSETEPNNDFTTANEAGSNSTIRGKIYDFGDEDYFKFSVESVSILTVSVKNVPKDLTPNIRIYDSQKRWVGSTAAFRGEEIEYTLEISEAGTYYLHLKDRYNACSSHKEYRIEIDAVSGADQYEPNPDFAAAKEIDIRKEIFGTIFPNADQDYFKFNIEEKGIFYIQMQKVPEGLRPSLKIYDSTAKVIAQKGGSEGEKIWLEVELSEPGQYYLLIKDWYSNFSSPDEYSFKTYFIKTLDEYEPSNSKDQAQLLDFGKNYFATISTKKDSDFYKLSIPDAGKIIVSLKDVPSNIRPYIKLYKSTRQSWINSAAGSAGEDLTMEFEVNDPSNYFIQIQDRYNSQSSHLRYRLFVMYIPDDEYALELPAIFKKTLEISNVIDKKEIELEIPGIDELGKYYLQAVLKSPLPEKNSQAVERFYVGDLEPIASPEIKVSCLKDENTTFDAGGHARFRFKAINEGNAGGPCQFDFKFMDLFSQSASAFLEPGNEKELEFEFLLPVDLEEGLYKAEYTYSGEKQSVNFKILGVKIDAAPELKGNVFKLNIENKGSMKKIDLFAEIRCGSYEEKKEFSLVNTKDLIFNVPQVSGQDKIYYGIYFSSGKALYLDSYLLSSQEEELCPIKIIKAACDREGDTIKLEWKIDAQDQISVELALDLAGPDGQLRKLPMGNLRSCPLDKGINVLDREIQPELTSSGLYTVLYGFIQNDTTIAQGSLFFDVGNEVKIDVRSGKREYMEGEEIKITVSIFASFSLDGDLNVFLDNKIIETKPVQVDGFEEFDFSINDIKPGKYKACAVISYDDTEDASSKEDFRVKKKPKPNNSPVLFTIGEKQVTAGELLGFSVDGMDIDGDKITYSAGSLPDGAIFDAKKFSWMPSSRQAGEHFVTFSASDGMDAALERIKIIVKALPVGPQAKALAAPVKGMAPLEVNFATDSVDMDGQIVRYEWDFDGKGVYDFDSLESGKCTFIYTGEGSFSATLRVTDNEGFTDTHSVTIDVKKNPSAPTVDLEAMPLRGTAPCKIYFQGSAFSPAEVCRYEWDFNGDGVYDANSTESANMLKTYGVPGVYDAEFRVTSSKGLSHSTSVKIEVLDPFVLSAEPVISDQNGNVPVQVDFDADVDADNEIQKYQWDFEGDGDFDFTSTDTAAVSHTYYKPGVYSPVLRVTDGKNIAAECKSELRFSVSDAQNIKKGKLVVKPKKGKAPFTAGFSFDSNFAHGDASYFWDFNGDGLCDIVTSLAEAEHTYYDAGVYVAEVNVKTADDFIRSCREAVYVTNGKRSSRNLAMPNNSELKTAKNVLKNRRDKIELSDKTSLLLPAGVLYEDDVVDIEKLEEYEVTNEIIFETEERISSAGEYREYKFGNHKKGFTEEMTISIPYADEDGDGIVDGKNINELTLDAYWFNEDSGEWEMLSDGLVFPDENLVMVKTNHFSLFGIAGAEAGGDDSPAENPGGNGDDAGGGNGSSGGGGCFIASAAFGTPLTEEVKVLCEFRDKHLLKSKIGKSFVNLYYSVSPPIAEFIKSKPMLKAFVRYHLKFLVKLTKVVL
ncbi:MAG: hypothetical protein KKD11_00455 [Candidatus Omnitrophica bacterium]|nr:hypothetical protein [Candidatus Omnitrophota bacterium]